MAKGGKANILAVAYSDLNGNGKFDGNKELIADVVDTNHDKTVSAGDTVNFGTYPLHVDGTGGRGTFTDATETITGGVLLGPNYVEAETVAGTVKDTFFWSEPSLDGFERFYASKYDSDTTQQYTVDFKDSTSGEQESVLADLGAPGAPDTQVYEQIDHPGDQLFINVDFFFT